MAWVALSLLLHIGHKTLHNLLNTFETTDAILEASAKDLVQVKGIGQKIAQSIVDINLGEISKKVEEWQQKGVMIVPQTDANYPQKLREIPDPPLTLFMRGKVEPSTWQNAVAIVGTRQPSQQAEALASELAVRYADAGWTIVSGLAMGIDAAAHEGAIRIKAVPKVAVLGGGVLNVYPQESWTLAHDIMREGALVSENSPDAKATAPRLVTRNRIISGLCQHIIVVESSITGGAMHAAKAAFIQNRKVYTVKFPQSGNQELLKQGATEIDPLNPYIPPVPSS